MPDLLFVIDTNKEAIAIQEANKLGIPVVAVVDSNSNPEGIAFPIPGNDDAARAIALYCDLVARAVIDGLSASARHVGRRHRRRRAKFRLQELPNHETLKSRARLRYRVARDQLERLGALPMADITATMVKDLREKTGAGMMDCKNALNETQGRHGSRHRLAAQKGPVEGREESRQRRRRRPRAVVSAHGGTGAVVEVNSQTDFVARNPESSKTLVVENREPGARRPSGESRTLAQHAHSRRRQWPSTGR